MHSLSKLYLLLPSLVSGTQSRFCDGVGLLPIIMFVGLLVAIISEATNSINSNKNLYALIQTALLVQPEIDEEVIRRCYLEVVEKVINASASTVFKLFHELFIGHYSKNLMLSLGNLYRCR